MRFLLSAVTLLALVNTLNAKLMTASVGPITENSIPDWAQPSIDRCRKVGSCDVCQPHAAQYCYYTDTGDATCCMAVNSAIGGDDGHETNRNTLTDTNDNINNNDRDNDNNGNDIDARKGLVASVGPIMENPIPSWGQPSSDACVSVGSCDACIPIRDEQTSQYCYYKDNGDATCCQGNSSSDTNTNTTTNNDDNNSNNSKQEADDEAAGGGGGGASVGPIEEEPIPVWARPSDACTRRRSCDVCQQPITNIQVDMNNVYCKYTETGVPMCCTGNRDSGNTNSNHEIEVTLISAE